MTYTEILRNKILTFHTLTLAGVHLNTLARVDADWGGWIRHHLNPASHRLKLHPQRIPFFNIDLNLDREYAQWYGRFCDRTVYLSKQFYFDWYKRGDTPNVRFHLLEDNEWYLHKVGDKVPKRLARLRNKIKSMPKHSIIVYKDKVLLFYTEQEYRAGELAGTILERIVETKQFLGKDNVYAWTMVREGERPLGLIVEDSARGLLDIQYQG